MVRQLFSLTDATSILNIPLSSRLPRDRLVWAYTPKGCFIVKSEYKVAMAIRDLGDSWATLSNQTCKKFWKRLWELNVPNKVKTFAWWASKNIILTKVNLCHKNIPENPVYGAWETNIETSGHVFWNCTIAREVLTLTSIPFETQEVVFPEFMDFMWYLMYIRNLGDKVLKIMVMVAYCLWLSRNEVQLANFLGYSCGGYKDEPTKTFKV